MNIITFGASSSKNSINKKLATCAADLFKAEINGDAVITVLDLNDFEMPIYSIDRENENGIPDLAQQFFNTIGNADTLIVSFAAHNGTYSAAYKNIFDWASRIDQKVFQNKPMIMLATSPGKGGAQSVLDVATSSAPHFAGIVKGSLSVPAFYGNFDVDTNTLKSTDIQQSLLVQLKNLT